MRVALLGLILVVSGLSGRCAAQEKPGKKVAFLVGVNQYQKPYFKNLRYAERDVAEMAKELKSLGFDTHVILGKKATRQAIDEKLRSLVEPLGKDDLMLLMLSGHGTQRDVPTADGGQRNDAFYCPYDATERDSDTLLSLSYVVDEVLAPNVGRKLLLVDACRDEPNDPARGSRGIEGKVIALPEDTAVLFSCRKGQQSFESEELQHGLFTYCILEGLRGKAVRDGEIAWSSLTDHVNRRMASRDFEKHIPEGRQQEPIPAGGVPHTLLGATHPAGPVVDRGPRPKSIKSRSCGMELLFVPGGTFPMGSSEENIKDVLQADKRITRDVLISETPQVRRTVEPFYAGRFEVTQGEFHRIMRFNPSKFSRSGTYRNQVRTLDTDQFPVECVTWYDAVAFCNALSTADGVAPYYAISDVQTTKSRNVTSSTVRTLGGEGYRLPSEVEWEYACRGGTTTAFYFGRSTNGAEVNVDAAHAFGTTKKGIPPLDRPTLVNEPRFPSNKYGLAHMHGNVAEWCEEWFDPKANENFAKRADSPYSSAKVIRGGSYSTDAWATRSASRSASSPDKFVSTIGFRVVRSAGKPENATGGIQ